VRRAGRLSVALVVGAGVLASSAAAAERARYTLAVGGGVSAGTLDWSARSGFTLYAEQARIDASYAAGSGAALEATLGYRFSPRLGVAAAVGWSWRDSRATFVASLPHPLYLDRPRSLDARADGLDYRDLAMHLDLEWRAGGGCVEWALFAGPSLVRAETSLVESVEANEQYPYDEVSFRLAVTRSRRSAFALGWNAGGSLGLRIGARTVVGLQARYARAPVELAPPGSDAFRVEAGGLQVIGFLRLRF
jgi:hypothetical protein